MHDVTLRQLVELGFTVFPYGFTYQFFELIAAILNAVSQALGLNIKFLGM